MTGLSQRRIAASILKTGENRIWIDPERIDRVESAITRDEVRRLIHEGAIRKRREQGISKGRRVEGGRGPGSRKGPRKSDKRTWILKVRKQRRRISQLRDEKRITPSAYRKVYAMVKGGAFRSVAHLNEYLEAHGMIKRR